MQTQTLIKFCFTLLFYFVFIEAYSQDHEVSVEYRYGISTRNLTPIKLDNFSVVDYSKPRPLYDHGMIVSYSQNVWEERKLFFTAGIEYAESKHYRPIVVSPYSFRVQENILISSKRYSYRLGLNKQFSLYESKMFLDFGVHFVKRNPVKMRVNYDRDYDFGYNDEVMYGYELKLYYDGIYDQNGYYDNTSPFNIWHWSAEFNSSFKLKVYDDFFLKFGFSFSRNNKFFHLLRRTWLIYEDGELTKIYKHNDGGSAEDNYLFFNTGLTYMFNHKKKSKRID